jgi:hypothetical protein
MNCLIGNVHRQRPVLWATKDLRRQIGAKREDEHHDHGGNDGVSKHWHHHVEEGQNGRGAECARRLRQRRI